MRHLLQNYEVRFQRRIYFVNQAGQVMLTGDDQQARTSILQQEGIGEVAHKILNHQTEPMAVTYSLNEQLVLLNTRFIPELGWYLIVEQNETADLRPVQTMFQFNLLISALVTLLVLFIATYSINRSQSYLEALAKTDGLTRLLNRHAFEAVLTQKRSELTRRLRSVSGILVDIDFFKQVNDQFGHTAGDEVLRQVANLLRKTARSSDTVARWGGEEFVILLDDCPKVLALELAERLRLAVAEFDFALPDSFQITISLGVVELLQGETEVEFFQRADQLLYAAKSSGRNRVMADL
nr:GGDEF domain-containing protein [uncultured Deefgea sp.]